MTVLVDIPFSLDPELLAAKYRVRPASEQSAVFAELVLRVQEVGRPKALYEVFFIDDKGEDWICAGGVTLTSRALRKNLDPVERIFPYVATCGAEVDSIDIPQGEMSRKAWLYFLKGELLQAATAHVQQHVAAHYQIAKLSSMNPGSGDAALWPLAQQRQLFALLDDVEGRIGVRLTDSWLLVPEMSVSGVFFPTEADFQSCQACHRERCPSRRAPFSQEVWDTLHRD